MNSYLPIRKMLITEKGSLLGPYNKHIFEVDKRANKIQIKQAIEDIYNVKVKSVATLKMPSKPRRLRWWQEGRTASSKKAVVTLEKGYTIEV